MEVGREHGAEFYRSGSQILRRWPGSDRIADPQGIRPNVVIPAPADPRRVQLEPTQWVVSPPLLGEGLRRTGEGDAKGEPDRLAYGGPMCVRFGQTPTEVSLPYAASRCS